MPIAGSVSVCRPTLTPISRAKRPTASLSSASARQIVGFLHLGLGGEEGLFQQAFRARGLSRQDVANLEYLPTTLNYSGYLRRRAYEGSYIEVIATLLAVEWPYLDWAQRLEAAGKHPTNHYFQTWIDIHTSEGMSGFVGWLRHTVDAAEVSSSDKAQLQTIFRDVLRYEVLFFDMAYQGEAWPR